MHKITLRFLVALSTFTAGVAAASAGRAFPDRRQTPTAAQAPARVTPAPGPDAAGGAGSYVILGGDVSFALPGDMSAPFLDREKLGPAEASGGWSFVNARGLKLTYRYDGGSCIYPVRPSEPPAGEEVVVIDGVRATSGVDRLGGSDRAVAYVCFPPARGGGPRLSMMAYARDPEGVEVARQIFQSVRFRR